MIWLILLWVACGVACYGYCFAYFQRAFPFFAKVNKKLDIMFSLFIGVFGPITLIAIIIHMKFGRGYKGFKFY